MPKNVNHQKLLNCIGCSCRRIVKHQKPQKMPNIIFCLVFVHVLVNAAMLKFDENMLKAYCLLFTVYPFYGIQIAV